MPATGVAFPARCAVTVGYGRHLVSQVFPAAIAVEEFFEGMVELLDADLRGRGLTGIAGPAGGYELHRINGVRLDLGRSLDELGVQDGDTLILVPAVPGESFEPQYESLSSALAATARGLGTAPELICAECGQPADERAVAGLLARRVDPVFAPVTVRTAAHTAVALLAATTALVLGLALRARAAGPGGVPAAVPAALGLTLAAAAGIVRRGFADRTDLFSGFGWPAAAALATAVAVAAPGPLGAPHAVIGATVLALGAVGISTAVRAQAAVATGIVTGAALVVAVGAVRMFAPVSPRVLGICTLLGTLALVRTAPTVALWVARVRPPYFGSITGRDLFARRPGMPIDTVSPVTEDADADEQDDLVDISARGAAVAASARLINAVQVGICVAAAATLPIAVWPVLTPGAPGATGSAVLCAVVAAIFLTQGRGFAARGQAVALVTGGCAAVLVGIARYALAAPPATAAGFGWPAAVAIGFAGCGLAAGLLVPATKFVPWIRLAVEWLEVVAFVVAGVLGAALAGLFTWVRN